jgi:hypothetical protein
MIKTLLYTSYFGEQKNSNVRLNKYENPYPYSILCIHLLVSLYTKHIRTFPYLLKVDGNPSLFTFRTVKYVTASI